MFLMGCGPGFTYSNGSLLPCVEVQADCRSMPVRPCFNHGNIVLIQARSKLQKQDLRTMEIDPNAQDEYNIQRECTFFAST